MPVETRELVPTPEKPLAQEPVSVVPTAEPVEIFPQVNRTPKMHKVEQIIKGDLRVFLITKYSEEELSTQDISQTIGNISGGYITVAPWTISIWLRTLSVSVRSRPEGVSLAWQNPEKRKRITEGAHSPMAHRKRCESLSEYLQSLSESEKRDRTRPAREGKALLRSMG